MADGELFLEDLQAAIHHAFEEGIEPAALLLHPSTVIHVSDPALGLEPLGASEIDAIDTVPIEIVALNLVSAQPITVSYGTGPIRGFAVTLLIGIVTTIITGVFVSRTFMSMITRSSSARLSI